MLDSYTVAHLEKNSNITDIFKLFRKIYGVKKIVSSEHSHPIEYML